MKCALANKQISDPAVCLTGYTRQLNYSLSVSVDTAPPLAINSC